MGDVKVLPSENPVFRRGKRQFISASRCEEMTRARQSVVKKAVIKVNADLDPNDNEDIVSRNCPPEEASVTLGAIGEEEDEVNDIDVASISLTNDALEEASNTVLGATENELEEIEETRGNVSPCPLATEVGTTADEAEEINVSSSMSPTNDTSKETSETIEEEKITRTEENMSALSPTALFRTAGHDEADGKVYRFFDRVADYVCDSVGELTHSLEGAVRTVRHNRLSVEGPPENNIHLIHRPNQQLINLGLHIEKHDEGCRIARVIKDSIACRSKLEENDVIIKINGLGLRSKNIGDIISHFSEIDITKTFSLTIRRKIITDHGELTLIDIDVHITITLSENNIDFEVEVIVTSQKFKHQSTAENKYISQTANGRSPVYMRVNGKDVCMDTKTDSKARFNLELYKSRGSDRVCVIRNQPSNYVIDKNNGKKANDLLATKAPPASKNPVSSADTKFFYWISHPNIPNQDVFESVSKKGYYMICTNNNKLVLAKFNSTGDVPEEGRFRVIDA